MSILGLFIKEENSSVEPAGKVEAVQPATAQVSSFMPSTPSTPVLGTPDDKFVTMLDAVVSDNNIPGLDYIEFKQAIEKMKSLPMDEGTKLLSAYSIFESQGCTKEILLSSIDTYMGLINKEQQGFDEEMKSSFAEKVEAKNQAIETARQQIVELNNKIVELNTFIMTSTQESQQEEMQLRMAAANFSQSVQKVLSVMQSDKEKITNYIK